MPVLDERMRPESFYDLQRIDKKMEGKFLANCFEEIQGGDHDKILNNLDNGALNRSLSPHGRRKRFDR
jgi:hypothetical protein